MTPLLTSGNTLFDTISLVIFDIAMVSVIFMAVRGRRI
jgi:hypothetical protein